MQTETHKQDMRFLSESVLFTEVSQIAALLQILHVVAQKVNEVRNGTVVLNSGLVLDRAALKDCFGSRILG